MLSAQRFAGEPDEMIGDKSHAEHRFELAMAHGMAQTARQSVVRQTVGFVLHGLPASSGLDPGPPLGSGTGAGGGTVQGLKIKTLP